MQYESETPFSEITLGFFLRKSLRSQWRTQWKISPKHYGYGKAVPRQVDIIYVGRPLLDNEEGCAWYQILVKVICLYILEGSFCLFHEHIKYYFAHLISSVSLKICLIEKFCIHIWIQHKKYCWVHLWKSVGQKKVKFCWSVKLVIYQKRQSAIVGNTHTFTLCNNCSQMPKLEDIFMCLTFCIHCIQFKYCCVISILLLNMYLFQNWCNLLLVLDMSLWFSWIKTYNR